MLPTKALTTVEQTFGSSSIQEDSFKITFSHLHFHYKHTLLSCNRCHMWGEKKKFGYLKDHFQLNFPRTQMPFIFIKQYGVRMFCWCVIYNKNTLLNFIMNLICV